MGKYRIRNTFFYHCCGSVTLWYRTVTDPDLALLLSGFQDGNTKLVFFLEYFAFLKATFTSFFKDKKSQNSINQGFLTFCLMMEGSGFRSKQIMTGLDPQHCFR
jgi:hypothetical protein